MLTLTVRTDKPEAELGLYANKTQLAYETWQAHRQLAETIHLKIKSLLDAQAKQFSDIEAVVIFKGPGSFTGLRIGCSVVNALAVSLRIPIVATQDPQWLEVGLDKLLNGANEQLAIPEYGAPARTTQQKK